MQAQQKKIQKLISFVIPAYEVPTDMLQECIQSIRTLSLSPSEREIILVDDGSKEPLLTALGEATDDIVYIRQKNSGVAVARNTGLKMADAVFVQFVDADDVLLRTPYEHVIDLIRFNECDMVMYDFTENPSDAATVIFNDQHPISGASVLRLSNIHGSVWGYIFRRSITGSLRFTPGVAYGEDEEFTPQLLLRADSVIVTNAKAYYYRQRPTSAINRDDIKSLLSRLNNTKSVILGLKHRSGTLPPEERLAMQRRVAQLTMDYIYNIITITQNRHYLNRQLEELRKEGLFPLPDRDYTKKYKWFRRMTSTSIGITILMRTLPILNKER